MTSEKGNSMKDLITRANALKARRDEFKRLYVVSEKLAVLKQTARDGTVSYYCMDPAVCLFLPVASVQAAHVVTASHKAVAQSVKSLRIHEDELGVTFEAERVTKFCSDRLDEIDKELRPLLRQIKKAGMSLE